MGTPVSQAIVTAAGRFTRGGLAGLGYGCKLFTPLYDRPVGSIVLGEVGQVLPDSGRIVTVLVPEHVERVNSFFRPQSQLQELRAAGKTRLAAIWESSLPKQEFHTAVQEFPHGPGHAVRCAKDLLQPNTPVMIVFTDNVGLGCDDTWASQMMECYLKIHDHLPKGTNFGVLGVKEVPIDDVARYGIVAPGGQEYGYTRVTDMVEKPRVDDAPSNMAIVGWYILPWGIFDALDRCPRGAGGELQLTDAIRLLVKEDNVPVYVVTLQGTWHDVGNPEGIQLASGAIRDLILKGKLHPTH